MKKINFPDHKDLKFKPQILSKLREYANLVPNFINSQREGGEVYALYRLNRPFHAKRNDLAIERMD